VAGDAKGRSPADRGQGARAAVTAADVEVGEPDLSLVATVRNEQYGGDLFGRAASFLRNVAWLSRRLRVRAEVIFVEWCPLPYQPPLAEILSPSNSGGSLPVRIVTVPTETATSRFERADEILLWASTAKNVGVRRAQSSFILATNPDVLFTPALFRAIGKRTLDRNGFYRTDRYDVTGVPLEARPRAQLARCRRSIVRVNLLGGSLRFDPPTGGVRLARAVRSYLSKQRSTQPRSRESRAARPTDWIHTNAAGVFFLAHRSCWEEIRGHPEFPSAGHLDGYLCVLAASAGMRQVILDGRRRLYHLEHSRAIDWDRPQATAHLVVPLETFLEDASKMLLAGKPTVFNEPSWGFGDLDLPEVTLRW
jgi:hypothetical protein